MREDHAKNEVGFLDPDWLRQRYEKDGWSTPQIAKATCTADSVVWRNLKRHGIPVRSRGHAIFLAVGNPGPMLSDTAVQFIEGELLGDGRLQQRLPTSIPARYTHTSKHEGYLLWLSATLCGFGIEQVGRILGYDQPAGRHAYHYTSRSYGTLGPMRRRWYPRGVKIVPTDLVLTPLMARQWYIGDGTVSRNNQTKHAGIVLCTQSFTHQEARFLLDSLAALGLRMSLGNARGKPILRMMSGSVPDFLNWIGPCPEPIRDIYGYKWEVG